MVKKNVLLDAWVKFSGLFLNSGYCGQLSIVSLKILDWTDYNSFVLSVYLKEVWPFKLEIVNVLLDA